MTKQSGRERRALCIGLIIGTAIGLAVMAALTGWPPASFSSP